MRLHLHFQVPDKVIDSDSRIRILVDVSLFPRLVKPSIWLYSHFQALGKGTNFEPRAHDKGCLWMCLCPPGAYDLFDEFACCIE